MYDFWPSDGQGVPVASLQLCSNRMPLGSSVGPFIQNQLYLRVSKGNMSLWCMLTQRPLMPIQRPVIPIQRPTLQVAAAVAVGALVLGTLYSLTQSFNIQFQHAGCLQCPLLSLSDLSEGLIVWIVSPPGPGLGFWLADGLGDGHGSPHWSSSSILVPPPSQAAPQGGQDVLDGLFPLLGPVGQ